MCLESDHRPHLSSWVSCIISGARNLTNVAMSVRLLACLPVPRRKVLTSLTLHASRQDKSSPDIVQAVMDCQQLKSLSISCPYPGWHLPEVDLRHLAHLDECKIQAVPRLPGLGGLYLSRGKGRLITYLVDLPAWMKLQHQLQNCLHDIAIWARSARVLRAWPQGNFLPSLEVPGDNLSGCMRFLR